MKCHILSICLQEANSLTLWKSFVCISYTWWLRGAFFVNPCIHPVPPPPECIAQSPGQTVWYVHWKTQKIGQETKLISFYNSSSAIHFPSTIFSIYQQTARTLLWALNTMTNSLNGWHAYISNYIGWQHWPCDWKSSSDTTLGIRGVLTLE